MTHLTKLLMTIVMLIIMTLVACQQSITMKALVLSTSEALSDTITLNLNAYGIPYDLVEFSPSSLLQGNLTLYENNEPKYNMVIINGGDLLFEVDNLWISALSVEQWAYLEEYESKNSIRRIVISEDVSSNPDVELYDPNNWGSSLEKQDLVVEESAEVKAIFNEARVKITAPLNVNSIYHTRVKIVNEETTKPFLYYADSNGKKGPVAATLTKYENGREIMSFFFGLGSWHQTSIILNHLWLTWGTRSLFNGFRRVYFTPHIDDVFLSTELVDIKHKIMDGGEEEYRTTPSDFQKIAKFQKDVLDIMPEGSFYRVELAFNGNGILIEGDYDESLKVESERFVELEFVMEPGKGEKRWPKENYKLTDAQIKTLKKDKLYNYFYGNETAQKEFFWSSHTFTHENLDNVAASDVANEISLNIDIARRLGLLTKDYWSYGSIITPQISGLHNKEALETFRKYGIYSATGDISRPPICNNDNPYLPFYTTMESSNLEGFPIIPRTPTEIYYFCSTKDEDTWSYNEIYRGFFDEDSTFDQIMEREGERTTLLMTKLRHEAHQFHQANLRYYPKEGHFGESLLEDWTRSVVNFYTKYVDWPLVSVKIDKQAETYIERAKLESCGHETKLIIENNMVTGISVTATTGDCTVPITVPDTVDTDSLPSDATLEQIGHDPLTVWIPLKKGETKSFQLSNGLEWKIDDTNVSSVTNTTVVPETTIVPSTTAIPSTTVPEATVVSETTIVPETTVIPSTTVPETTIVPETTVIPSTTVPETTIVPETTVIPSTTVPETTIVPETTVIPSTTVVSETTVVPNTTTITSTTTIVKTISTSVNGTLTFYHLPPPTNYPYQQPFQPPPPPYQQPPTPYQQPIPYQPPYQPPPPPNQQPPPSYQQPIPYQPPYQQPIPYQPYQPYQPPPQPYQPYQPPPQPYQPYQPPPPQYQQPVLYQPYRPPPQPYRPPPNGQVCSAGNEACGDFESGPTCCEPGYYCRRLQLSYMCLPY